MKWCSPHPPGTRFNLHPDTALEILNEYAVRFRFPEPDGLAVGKLRAMHLISEGSWSGPSSGCERQWSGEGHW